jgi:serine/threonine-protein kinase
MRFCPRCGARFSNDSQFCPHDGTATQVVDQSTNEDPLLGQVVDGRYRIEAQIGEGGMGVVYRARHVVLDKPLALKILRTAMAKESESVQRFINEAKAASSIGHPNIVDISDFGRLKSGEVYFVMEYLEGRTLSELIVSDGGRLEASKVVHVLTQIASALAAAHAQGIIHRDLKPDNILVVSKGGDPLCVKVLDFGIAKVVGANSKLTRTGIVFGTPHYMAPEQAMGKAVDGRTDLYALGVIAYELCTGEPPFDADTFMGVVTKHMQEAVEPPSKRLESFSSQYQGFEPIILKALAKKPAQRYPTMHAFIDSLQQASLDAGLLPRSSMPVGLAQTSKAEAVELVDSTAPVPSVKIPTRTPRRTAALVGLSAACLAVVLTMIATNHPDSGGNDPVAAASGNDAIEAAPLPTALDEPEAALDEPEAVEAESDVAEPPTGEDFEETAFEVRLLASPEDATVWLNGEEVGSVPFTALRPQGDEVLRYTLRAPRFRSETVVVSRTTEAEIEVSLEPQRVRRAGTELPQPSASPRPSMTMQPQGTMAPSMAGMSLESLRGFDEL